MARLGRTIYVTHCTGIGFDENNELFNVEVDISGNITDLARANNKVRKKLNNDKILIKEIVTTSKYYSMTEEEFIEHATMVTEHK